MELSTKGLGKTIKHMAKVYSGMSMVTSMKVLGRETKRMDTENIPTVTELPMKEIGKMIFNTARV